MKKIQFQLMCSVMSPPTSGPIASASAETPAQIPIAVPRWRGGKVTVMIESVAGFIIAAPTPCTTRAPISIRRCRRARRRATTRVKIARPTTKMRRRPKQVRELAARQHQRAERERVAGHDPLELGDLQTERLLWIDGSATFTIVLSSMIMKRPNETAPSVHHFRFSCV